MLYIYGLLVAAQIVAGQVLWKLGVERYNFNFNKDYIFSDNFIKFIFSPQVVFGMLIYAFATLSFMGLLAKYDYSNLQAVVVSSSLALTTIVAFLFFDEHINLVNALGFVIIVIGIVLVTKF